MCASIKVLLNKFSWLFLSKFDLGKVLLCIIIIITFFLY